MKEVDGVEELVGEVKGGFERVTLGMIGKQRLKIAALYILEYEILAAHFRVEIFDLKDRIMPKFGHPAGGILKCQPTVFLLRERCHFAERYDDLFDVNFCVGGSVVGRIDGVRTGSHRGRIDTITTFLQGFGSCGHKIK